MKSTDENARGVNAGEQKFESPGDGQPKVLDTRCTYSPQKASEIGVTPIRGQGVGGFHRRGAEIAEGGL